MENIVKIGNIPSSFLKSPLTKQGGKKESVCLWYILGITAIHGTDDNDYTDAEDDDSSNQYRVVWPGCGRNTQEARLEMARHPMLHGMEVK